MGNLFIVISILANVLSAIFAQDLDMGMMEDTHPDHSWYQLISEPGDFGFSGTARTRTWCIGKHDERTVCREDPFLMLDDIKSFFHENCQCSISDYLVSTEGDICMEALEGATKLGLKHFVPGRDSMSALLTTREARTMVDLDERYQQRFHEPASSNPNLVYGLGDNADFQSWSAVSGKIPTYRLSTSNSRYWLPAHQRWMSAKERLVSMGWPVCPAMSKAMNVPLIGASDFKRASDLIKVIGNSMHLQSTGVLQLIALACFGPS